MTEDYDQRLQRLKQDALDRYEIIFGADYPASVTLTTYPSNQFQALAVPDGDGIEIKITEGVIETIASLWREVKEFSDWLPEDQRLIVGNIDQAIDASLMWLILHELHHHHLEHFRLSGSAGIAEVSDGDVFGLSGREGAVEPSALDDVQPAARRLYRRCMELQADHDAMDIVFGPYSTEGWAMLRFYACAIFIVMVAIEQNDTLPDDKRVHPLAATRMFQMLGNLATLWQPIEDHLDEMPSDEEIEVYHGAVVAPAVADARLIARAIKSDSILASLGSEEEFVGDLRMLQKPQDHDLTDLKTVGAREYASLTPINAQVIELIGSERFYR